MTTRQGEISRFDILLREATDFVASCERPRLGLSWKRPWLVRRVREMSGREVCRFGAMEAELRATRDRIDQHREIERLDAELDTYTRRLHSWDGDENCLNPTTGEHLWRRDVGDFFIRNIEMCTRCAALRPHGHEVRDGIRTRVVLLPVGDGAWAGPSSNGDGPIFTGGVQPTLITAPVDWGFFRG